ncbi:YqaA family protein [Thiomicrorhabdus sp. 6S3-12]|uniref:YqaA family protein n=1 Tax=Thiomicrorhabdus sp. 6S3-12 TaxID=2819681 RepID=UPI001AAE0555|nr:YqaA family protein [Thiomicrorhabdus sp. 6S3-12]MBO1924319.1 DedA family protein [Thiomicrorhabdus sp. 6S3-12]
MFDYLTLFILALLSATLLPGGSEVYLLTLAQEPQSVIWLLWLIATIGNTLGSAINYLLGRYLLHWQDRKWFPVSPAQLNRGQKWFNRYGYWSLLLAWAPLFGDALTLLAGIMRLKFILFLLLVFTGKAVRYALVLGVAQGIVLL